MRNVDNRLNIINQKLDEINQRIEQRINLDDRFSNIFSQKTQSQTTIQNNTQSLEELLKQMNINNNFQNNILNSINRDTIIDFRGFKMKAEVASKFLELERMIKQYFPGREIIITSAMDGKHMPNSAHYRGEAIDFVVEPLTIEESKIVEKLAEKAGFKVYNEYIYDSPYKTGPHMHIQL
ncbi:MAG: hypothetical protein RMJ36_05575 [Candidatus Calescibacterium sp.]|nr:hypothetical protein [Candidatus Calescibacterium sp.]MDW8133106.1 hypothetical protein [Candidatus Calescibacterium sp.]